MVSKEEAFYKQKYRIQWLDLGDSNTRFFHKTVSHRQAINRITSLIDADGEIVHNQDKIGQMAVSYFQDLLNEEYSVCIPPLDMFERKVSDQQNEELVQNITDDEIKQALFSIPDDKSPVPDGFPSCFFKKTWHITGLCFIRAMRSFITSGKLLGSFNATKITVVPKV